MSVCVVNADTYKARKNTMLSQYILNIDNQLCLMENPRW